MFVSRWLKNVNFVPDIPPLNSLDLVKFLPVSLYICMHMYVYMGLPLSLKLKKFPALFCAQRCFVLYMASPKPSWFLASDWRYSVVSQEIRGLGEKIEDIYHS